MTDSRIRFDAERTGSEVSVREAVKRLELACEFLACDPSLADTAAFCAHYGISPEDSANAIIVASRKPPAHTACCLVLATDRLDVNRRVCAALGVKKASFLDAEATRALTGQMIGGVTLLGLPPHVHLLVDARVMTRSRIVIGGGSRSLKLRLAPGELCKVPGLEVLELTRRPPSGQIAVPFEP